MVCFILWLTVSESYYVIFGLWVFCRNDFWRILGRNIFKIFQWALLKYEKTPRQYWRVEELVVWCHSTVKPTDMKTTMRSFFNVSFKLVLLELLYYFNQFSQKLTFCIFKKPQKIWKIEKKIKSRVKRNWCNVWWPNWLKWYSNCINFASKKYRKAKATYLKAKPIIYYGVTCDNLY